MTDIIQDNILLQLICMYPLLVIIGGVIITIYFKFKKNTKLFKLSLFVTIGILLCEYMNNILKNKVFIPLGNIYGSKINNNTYLGILGRIGRPDGACNSGVFRNGVKVKTLSSGMPSGHSQLAWFIYGFFVTMLIDKKYKHKNAFIILGGIFSGLISYSRVIVNCHTIEQIIVGSMIGYILGYSWYKLYKLFK